MENTIDKLNGAAVDTATAVAQEAPVKSKMRRLTIKVPENWGNLLLREYDMRTERDRYKEEYIGSYLIENYRPANSTVLVEEVEDIIERNKVLVEENHKLKAELSKKGFNYKKAFYVTCGAALFLLIGFFVQMKGKIKAQAAI